MTATVRRGARPWREALPKSVAELRAEPYWEALSSAAQRIVVNAAFGPPSPEELLVGAGAAALPFPLPPVTSTPTAPGLPVNVRVNDPAEDAGAGNNTTQSEPSLAVSPPYVVVGFNDSNPISSLSGLAQSDTVGQAFADEGGVAGNQSGDAVVAVSRGGTFYYAMLSRTLAGLGSIGVSRSTDHGVTFGAPVDASTTANGTANFQDKEWLTVDTTGGAHDGNVYLAWTNFANSFATAQIMFVRSTDGGLTWSAPLALSTAGPGLGHQGAMPSVAPNGDVYVVWLDRATSQLLVRRSTDGGVAFANPVAGGGAVQAITQLPARLNGNIRANSFPSIALDPHSGAIYIAYPARTANDQANVYLTHSTDQGQTWSAPLQVNDDGGLTDQWMPSVAVADDGVVGVMFYDRRNDAANNLNIDVYLALSTNGGTTVLPNQRITTISFPPVVGVDPRINSTYMGDYNQMVAVGNRFYLAWGDNRDVVGTRHDANVYYAVVGTEDCYVRDNPADDGSVPSAAGQAWQSPDIRPDMNPSVFGTPNPVHIEVHNSGVHDAANVTTRLYWADPATHIPRAAWRPDRITVGGVATNEQVIAAVPHGGSAEPPLPFVWDPPQPGWATEVGHFCLLAEIEGAGDPLTFTGGGWQTIERDNNLAVRNVHVQPMAGHGPARIVFFVAGDLEKRWKADLVINPQDLPQGFRLTLTLPAAILKGAEFEALEVAGKTDKAVTLAVIPGRVGRIHGVQLRAKGRYRAEVSVEAAEGVTFKGAPFTITQVVDGQTVGGLRYELRPGA